MRINQTFLVAAILFVGCAQVQAMQRETEIITASLMAKAQALRSEIDRELQAMPVDRLQREAQDLPRDLAELPSALRDAQSNALEYAQMPAAIEILVAFAAPDEVEQSQIQLAQLKQLLQQKQQQQLATLAAIQALIDLTTRNLQELQQELARRGQQ